MGMEAPHPTIRRHFVTVGRRQVHYRRAGRGPAIVLCHQSPSSSRETVPLIERLMGDFTVFALDTPGNGLSDPLALEKPSAEDYARGLADTLDALGIRHCGIFGTHTGGCTASEFARLFPERVSVFVVDGVTCWTPQERAEILANYLTPMEIQWDGSHLVWLWSRFRQQAMFFPWYKAARSARLDFDMPTPERIQHQVLDFLRAGNEYRKPYAAAFMYEGDRYLAPIKTPGYLIALELDVLYAHFDRLPPLPSHIKVERLGRDRRALLDRVVAIFKRHPPSGDTPAVVRPKPIAGRTWQDYADVRGGQLHLRRSDSGMGRPVLVQHDAASDNNVVRGATESFVDKRPVLAFDLPGNGESDNTIGHDNISCTTYAEVTRQALESMGVSACDYVGTWGSGFTGLELAKLKPGLVRNLVITHVIYHDATLRQELIAHYTPDWQPDWYGGHLLFCWHAMRDQGIFWPWYERSRKGIIRREPYVDPNMVHRRVVSMMKCGNMWSRHYGAHWRYPAQEELKRAPVPTVLAAPEGHPGTQQALGHASALASVVIGNDMSGWAGALLPRLAA
ncbi:MAG: alpha/beta fold hydrolase [Alphaproteobacteria bacterium]|nr:alpha/beta fold hydrolase [Alphaproteobacteria bacterium]